MTHTRARSTDVSVIVSDVDGTLLTDEKVLTARALAAVTELQARGYIFSIISARPPRGMRELVHALDISAPFAAFNGGAIRNPDNSIIDRRVLAPQTARLAIKRLGERGVPPWVFTDEDWLVLDADQPEIAREYEAVNFLPEVVGDFDSALNSISMIVAVGDVSEIARCEQALRAELSDGASITRSHPNHLDISHPGANKGDAITRIAQLLKVSPHQIAVLGDGENDTLMFDKSGLAIAMGNADAGVQAKADFVTASCNDEGFAQAIERYFLTNGPSRSDR